MAKWQLVNGRWKNTQAVDTNTATTNANNTLQESGAQEKFRSAAKKIVLQNKVIKGWGQHLVKKQTRASQNFQGLASDFIKARRSVQDWLVHSETDVSVVKDKEGTETCVVHRRQSVIHGDDFDFTDFTVIYVVGGPGAGKGTQCQKISEKYGCHHLSTGDLLRREIQRGSELGKEIEAIMKDGGMVPQELTIELIKNEMKSVENPDKGFLLDGFPRAVEQVPAFEEQVVPAKGMLWFDCDEDELIPRLLERGKSSGRADDNEESIRKRIQTFREKTQPVLDLFEKEGNSRARTINASGTPEDVFAHADRIVEDMLALETLSL
eukprot:m.32883 g.32883  ORF g.32883 m.32883 type:complete len:323 (+) comp8463_c0_seq2:245-1213(+)